MPTHVPVPADMQGLEKDSVVLLEQVRTLDKKRLGDYIGTLDRQQMLKVDKALCSRACLKIAFRKMSSQFTSDFMLDLGGVVGYID